MLEIKALRWVRDRIGRQKTPKHYPLPSAEAQRKLSEYFCAQNTAAIEQAIAEFYNGARVTVRFDPAAVRHAMSCAWSRTETHSSTFTFPTFEPGHLLDTVVNRWLALSPLFFQFDRSENLPGRIVINFNDAGMEPGLAFSGDSPDHVLIPDSDFFKTRGYARAREHFDRHFRPWNQRSPSVFWRGSSLGQKHHAVLDMPRARLCQIANAAAAREWFDVGMVEVFDVREADAARLRAADLIRDRVPWKQLRSYRYHVDIDGNANSFAGLFLKLLSGSLVMKVASPNRYAQWYYDRLKPWENFVPIRSDMSDLLEIAAYCRAHDDLAQRIAQSGRQLTRSLTFEKEFNTAVETVKQAFARS